jgi:2-dehydro-3-deoxyphosphogluconate aldolase / (4S)-4-hydroxy-2-oxoglutarate aldolase
MAYYSRIEVALTMKEMGIVPVFFNANMETCLQVLKASYDGGLRVFEFTNRGDFAHETFSELVKYSRKNLPGMILGAGSIVDAATASLYIQNGANFIVSPILNEEIARVCNRRKILWSPGCATLSEISKAEELGAEIVKIFPAKELGGPSFVKSIRGPMPWTSIMPTGGVEPSYENLSQWFIAGVWCVGLGSNLFSKKALDEGNYDAIVSFIKETLAIVKKIRNELK